MTKRVLIIGGAGIFGFRLAEGLARSGYDLVLAGRELARAGAAARAVQLKFPGVSVSALAIDTRRISGGDIARTGCALVVDASGPFQGARPSVAAAAIASGVDYVDLADARDFVAAFAALDADARQAGVVALTGASSTPALSNAVVDVLTDGWRRIDTIDVAIVPGNRMARGRSVVEAILTWAGRPVRVFEDGAWREEPGWTGSRPVRIDGLGQRHVALADTPDLDLFVARHRPRWRARFAAGLELKPLHFLLVALSHLRHATGISTLVPAADAMRRAADLLLGFGSDRGGMAVDVAGRDRDDRPVVARWSLVAEAGSGPNVPTLAALAAIRKILQGRVEAGARACVGDVTLDEINAELAIHPITTVKTCEPVVSVFARTLGPSLAEIPAPIRISHEGGPVTVLVGCGSVESAAGPVGRCIARIAGFPGAGVDIPVTVAMETGADGREKWTRWFGEHRFSSRLRWSGPGRYDEQFGIVSVALDVAGHDRGADIRVAGWRVVGLAMPRFLAPRTEAIERVDGEGRFTFDIDIALPVIGRIVRYHGWLCRSELADAVPPRDEIALSAVRS